jgi:hypothetical protein
MESGAGHEISNQLHIDLWTRCALYFQVLGKQTYLLWLGRTLPPPTASSLTFSLAMRRRENPRFAGLSLRSSALPNPQTASPVTSLRGFSLDLVRIFYVIEIAKFIACSQPVLFELLLG